MSGIRTYDTSYRLVIPREPTLEQLQIMTSNTNQPFLRSSSLFSISNVVSAETDEKQVGFYAMHSWKTMDEDGVWKTCAASVWEISCEEGEFKVDCFKPTIVGDKEIRDHTCSPFAEDLLKQPRWHLVHGFSRDDPGALARFTRTHDEQVCTEHYVACIAKTLMHMNVVKDRRPEEIKALALTSLFAQPHTLNAILLGYGNDKRFDKNLPGHYEELSDMEKADYMRFQMGLVREKIRFAKADELKSNYMAWLEHNLRLDPSKTPPEFYKDEALLMDEEEEKTWDLHAGLVQLVVTSKLLCKEPINLRVAVSCRDATMVEIAPSNDRFGIKPPDDNTFDFVDTPEGKVWFVGLEETLGIPQRMFISKLDTVLTDAYYSKNDDDKRRQAEKEAFNLLTVSLDQYAHGITGLVKSIWIKHLTEPGWITDGLKTLITDKLAEIGIGPRWYIRDNVNAFEDKDSEDSYVILGNVGQGLPIGPAARSSSEG
jgi:hypothetical protein